MFDRSELTVIQSWKQAGEIFPTHLRGKGTTLCVASYSLINILWTQVSPSAFATIGWRFYLVFIACSLVSGVITLTTFPDTRNMPLEDIAAMFGDHDLVSVEDSPGDSSSQTRVIPPGRLFKIAWR
jgi:hypothetical protein